MVSPWEYAARHFEPPQRRWATPGDLAAELDRRTRQTPALDLIDDALVRLANTPDGRLIISMPPQEGKSTRVAKDFPTWLLTENPDLRIVTASYGQGLANRNGRAIRRNITDHDLGLTVAKDNGAVHEWQVGTCPDCWAGDGEPPTGKHRSGHDGGVLSVGVGAGVTGRPADILIIDDPIKDRREADSEVYREAVWEWWTDSASTRLAPGAQVVIILTRWHQDDLAGKLLAAEDGHVWEVLNIPAQADHDPAKGETDPLGREPGDFMQSARTNKDGTPRTTRQWEAIKVRAGSRTWTALYQGRPAPAEGGMFKRGWWRSYNSPQWVERPDGSRWAVTFDEVIASWDMAFKDTASSDYVVGQVWGRRGVDAYLLDQIRDRMDFVTTCQRFREFSARWPQAVLKIVEDKANGTAVMNALRRIVPGLVPEEPHESKEARAAAVTPFVEAGNVWLPAPELAPWVAGFLEEHAAFPTGSHDDQVDGTSQALNRLLLAPLLAANDQQVPEEFEELDAVGFSISPH